MQGSNGDGVSVTVSVSAPEIGFDDSITVLVNRDRVRRLQAPVYPWSLLEGLIVAALPALVRRGGERRTDRRSRAHGRRERGPGRRRPSEREGER